MFEIFFEICKIDPCNALTETIPFQDSRARAALTEQRWVRPAPALAPGATPMATLSAALLETLSADLLEYQVPVAAKKHIKLDCVIW